MFSFQMAAVVAQWQSMRLRNRWSWYQTLLCVRLVILRCANLGLLFIHFHLLTRHHHYGCFSLSPFPLFYICPYTVPSRIHTTTDFPRCLAWAEQA